MLLIIAPYTFYQKRGSYQIVEVKVGVGETYFLVQSQAKLDFSTRKFCFSSVFLRFLSSIKTFRFKNNEDFQNIATNCHNLPFVGQIIFLDK